MNLGLEGRNCIVIGASRGIGRAIARGLVQEGANVAICARGEGPLRQTADQLRTDGVKVHAAACDVADPEALGAFLDSSLQALGGVDVLIHNASGLALGSDLDSWTASLQVDLMAAVHACQRVLPWMTKAGRGDILFISSIAALEAYPSEDYGYAAAKAAQLAYMKKLAMHCAPRQIRVNALAPGSIEFPGGVWAVAKENHPELYAAALGSIPSGRLGTPEEVADVAVFLVSPRARWITGECVVVDGGQFHAMR
jgi:3-oxoacyl-[acyl-carrier protein] reductase